MRDTGRPAPRSAGTMSDAAVIESDIAPRLDRLPWDRFHTLVVVALGITWILDGIEVTLAGALAGALEASPVLRFTTVDVGITGSAYLAGAALRSVWGVAESKLCSAEFCSF